MSARVASPCLLSRQEAEDFLYHEAALLDEWRLEEWLALFTHDAVYEVPNPGAGDESRSDAALFLIADDYFRLGHRVRRLLNSGAHAEWPRSQCMRTINNVRILSDIPDEVRISATFLAMRAKNDSDHTFYGRMEYCMSRAEGDLRIRRKRVTLASENLHRQGRLSIIL